MSHKIWEAYETTKSESSSALITFLKICIIAFTFFMLVVILG